LDWREIVSRLAMLLMAALFAAGGFGLIHAGNVMYPYDSPSGGPGALRHGSGSTSHILYVGGAALIGTGGFLLVSAFAPKRKR